MGNSKIMRVVYNIVKVIIYTLSTEEAKDETNGVTRVESKSPSLGLVSKHLTNVNILS